MSVQKVATNGGVIYAVVNNIVGESGRYRIKKGGTEDEENISRPTNNNVS